MRCSALPIIAKCRGSYHLSEGYGTHMSRVGTAFHMAARAKVLNQDFDIESIRTQFNLNDDEIKDINYGLYNITLNIPVGAMIIADNLELAGLDGDLTGTPDLGIFHNNTLTVIDWKSGWGDVEDPETNPQLIGYALLIMEFLIAQKVIKIWEEVGQVNLVIVQPKLNQIKKHAMAISDLRDREKDIRKIISEAKTGKDNYTTGPWCASCFKSMKCPAFAGQMIELSNFIQPEREDIAIRGGHSGPITPEQLRKALVTLLPFAKATASAGARIEALAKAWVAENGPLELGGGQIYARTLENKTEINTLKAFGILQQYFSDDDIWEIMSISMSKITELAVKTQRGLSTIVKNHLKEEGAAKEKPAVVYRIIKGGDHERTGTDGSTEKE